MITDTKDGQTNYCPNCEDQARRIEELERHNRMLVEALNDAAESVQEWGNYADDYFQQKWNLDGDVRKYKDIANATPQQSRVNWIDAEQLAKQLSEANALVAMQSVALVNAAVPIEALIGSNAYKIHSITTQNELLNARNSIRSAISAEQKHCM